MKKIISSIAVAILLLSVPACNKKDTPQTTQQKILGKWILVTDVYNDHYLGADHISTQTGTANDYAEFKSDGNVYSSVSGFTNTTTYSIVSDTKINIDGDVYDIKTLTTNALILYIKNVYGADYDEETITFKK